MRNIKLIIAYDGTAYFGWQRQKNDITIQEVIEQKISLMTGSAVTLYGAGRTDTGVHALGMAANFKTSSKIPVDGFLKGLNSLLPADIRILKLNEIAEHFHARFSAKGKTYLYQFCCETILPPCHRNYFTHLPGSININEIQKCLDLVVGEHDFSSFETAGSRVINENCETGRGAVREIYSAQIALLSEEPRCYSIEISGDGFLRHMVRNILGSVFDAGKDKITVDDFRQIIKARDRKAAGACAKPCGLFLKEVFY